MEQQHWKTFESKYTKFKGITGYKNTSKVTDPTVRALHHIISIVEENQTIILRWDGKHSKEWFIVSHPQLITLTETNFHLYETLTNSTKGKPNFDIELIPLIDTSFEQHIQKSKDIILTQFPDANFQVSGSKTDDKWSYHIVLSNYIFTDYKKYILKMKAFTKCYPIFDNAIYTNNRFMKCVNQSKGYKKDSKTPDNRKQLIISGSASHSKHLITTDFDEDCKHFKDLDFTDYLVIDKEPDITTENRIKRLNNRKLGIDISCIKPTTQELPLTFSYFNSTQLQKFKVLPKMNKDNYLHHDIIMKICWWCMYHNVTFDDFWMWNKSKDPSEERRLRYLDIYQGTIYHVDNKFLDNILELYYPKIKKSYPFYRYQKYITGVDSLINNTLPKNTYIDLKDISNKKTEIITVGCGVGKTQVSIKYIEQHPEASVLIIVPRITLSYDIVERFKKCDIHIENYKDITLSYEDCRRLCVSAPSLYKTKQVYDIIIIDEFETLIDQFVSEKIHTVNGHSKLFDNWNTFKLLINRCSKLFLLDAITTTKTVNFVNRMGFNEFNIISNEKSIERSIVRLKKNKHEYVIQTEQRFFNLITNDLKKGLKLFIFMPYKTGRKEHCQDSHYCIRGVIPLTKFLCDKLNMVEGKDIVGYYAENFEAKRELRFVNTVWSNLKCIITNTTNSVGINYENADIDKIYIYQGSFTNPRDIIQVVKRPRKIKNTEMVLYTEPNYPNLFQQFLYPEFGCPVFSQLKIDLQLEREAFNLDSFKLLCERNSITFKDELVNEDDLEDLIKFEDSDDYCIRFKDLPLLTQEDYHELYIKSRGGQINYIEKLSVQKYHFINKFNFDIPIEDLRTCWMYRFYIDSLETLLDPNFVINDFLQKNKIDLFSDVPFEEFPIDGEIPHNFDLKSIKFLNSFEFKRIEKNTGQATYAKALTSFFGPAVFTQDKEEHKPVRITINNKKLYKYSTHDMFVEVLELFKKYHNNYYKNRIQNINYL